MQLLASKYKNKKRTITYKVRCISSISFNKFYIYSNYKSNKSLILITRRIAEIAISIRLVIKTLSNRLTSNI